MQSEEPSVFNDKRTVTSHKQPFTTQAIPQSHKYGNKAPSVFGTNAAILVRTGEGRKMYNVRNMSFEVDDHYDVIKAIGLGAYGLVCSAIDLRCVSDHSLFQADLLKLEEQGGMVIKTLLTNELRQFVPSERESNEGEEKVVFLPTLRYDPYMRQKLSNGTPSPYVAIKKVPKLFRNLIDGKRVLRETRILQFLRGHENVIRIHDVLYPRQGKEGYKDLYIISELMETDLNLVLKSRQTLVEDHIRYIMYQLLKCLLWVHSSGVVHRDLKPSNMLLTSMCEMKLCDFGLSRGGIPWNQKKTHTVSNTIINDCNSIFTSQSPPAYSARDAREDERLKLREEPDMPEENTCAVNIKDSFRGSGIGGITNDRSELIVPQFRNIVPTKEKDGLMELTDYVITRYYRPPELLIMSQYNSAADIWSAGCIMAEIILNKPLFAGRDYLSQLTMIAQTSVLRGLPGTPEELDDMFIGGTEGKLYLKELLFKRKSRAPVPVVDTGSPLDDLRLAFFGKEMGRKVSDEAVDLLSRLLCFDPYKRLNALDAMRHPYFSNIYSRRDECVRDPVVSAIMVAKPLVSAPSPNSGGYCTSSERESKSSEIAATCVPAVVDASTSNINNNNSSTNVSNYNGYYESEEEGPEGLWEFDQRELNESDLRLLFFNEMEKFHRRKTRFNATGKTKSN